MEDPNMIEIMEIEERLAMDSGEAPEKLEPYEEPEIDNSIVEIGTIYDSIFPVDRGLRTLLLPIYADRYLRHPAGYRHQKRQ